MSPDPTLTAIVAALLSLVVWRRYPEHAPIALALSLSAARDAAGPLLRGVRELDAGLLCVVACASGRSYMLAWEGVRRLVADVLWGGLAPLFFVAATIGRGEFTPYFAYLAAVVSGGLAFNRWEGERTVATDTALVLLLGDGAGLAFGWRDDAVPWQAAVQLGAAIVVQALWLIAGRGTPSGPSSRPPRAPSLRPRARPS